ncbi:TonB-dependent receptor [Phenylobacterium sp. LjRoot219]|uniref:TonB-dependent receptor n=1 Tax=Phenylobacterium sp. LjRoot219 TaxID=3342283 RepID=UPI003ECC990F
MRSSGRLFWLLASTALACGAGAPAWAQSTTSKPAAATELDTVVVTARRMEERLQDVPISITVYNQDQLSNRNIVNSTDLAAYTPSLAVNGRYGSDKSSFVIRGFSQDLNTLPTVGVYFADAVAPRLTSNITSGNGAGVGSMFDLQNVQVLKGPQGTLFGRNTTGGAILLVPQRPTDRFEGYVEGTLGNLDARRIEAVVNVPITDSLRVRAGVDRNVRDGFINNRSGIGPSDFSDMDYFAGRLSVLWDLTPQLENYTVLTYAKSDTHGTLPRIAYCNRGTVPGSTGSTAITRAAACAQYDRETAAGYGFYDASNINPDPFVKSRTWQGINTTTWHATDNLTVKNILSYGVAKERYSFSLSGDFIPFPFVLTYPGPDTPQGHQWTFTEEFQLQGRNFDDRLNWQAGLYLERSEPKNGQEQYTQIFSQCTNIYAFQCTPLTLTVAGRPVPAGSVSIARNNYYYRNTALYAQGTYNLTDQFSLTAGIRNTWDWQKETADNIRVITSAAGPLVFSCSRAATPAGANSSLLTSGVCGVGRTFKTKSSEPTWLLNLDYKPNDDTLLYAKYARGYRGGGINEANFGAETWEPETVDNYELGLKTSFRGQVQGTFNIAGFWNEFKDQQASVFIPQCTANIPGCTNPAPTGINGIQNIGRSRLRGVEVDGSLLLSDQLRLDYGYAYLDAKVTGGSVPFCDNTRFICSQASFLGAGTVLPFAPKNRFTMTATYTLPLDESIGDISLGATFTHTSEYFTGHGSDAAFAAGAIPFNASLSPATDLLNLNLNWRNIAGRPVDLAVYATNIGQEKYYVAAANALSTVGAEYLILGEPRMYGVRLRYRFGGQ